MADSEREQFFPTTPFTPTFGLFTPEVDAFRNLAAAAALGESEGAFEEAEDRFSDISSKVAGIRDLPEVEQVDATAKLLRDENLSSHVIGQILGVSNAVIENILNQNNYDLRGNPIKEEVVDLDEDTTDPDPLLTIDPSLASVAANTGPFVQDNNPNQKAIDAFIDLISGKYKKDKKDITPIDVAGVGTILAGQGSDNQTAAVTGSTPTGGTPQGQTVTPQGETSIPQGSTPTPQGGTPQGGTPASDTPAVDSPNGTPTVSTGSVLDQTGTGDVTVDDQPKGFLTGMTPEAQAIINEGNRYDITATMLGPLIAKQDVPIIQPLQFQLNNVPQSNFAQALLTSDGLMRSFV